MYHRTSDGEETQTFLGDGIVAEDGVLISNTGSPGEVRGRLDRLGVVQLKVRVTGGEYL